MSRPPSAGSSRPQLLLMDVMSTLVYDPFRVEMPAFLGMTLEQLMAAKHPTAWAEFETGAIDEDTLYARFFLDGRPLDGPGLKAETSACYRWLDGMEELVRDLANQDAPMHVLSNYPHWYHQVEEATGLSRYLPWSFVSCDTGRRKPAPEAFLEPAESLGVDPSHCLLVDDSELNIRAATDLGMDSIHFQGATTLRADLAKRGFSLT